MLITTGKNPDRRSRLIARALAAAIPGSRLENRGRRTLASLVSKARGWHFFRLCEVYRADGGQDAIAFMEISGDGWNWLSPKILAGKVSCHLPAGKPAQSRCLEIGGAKSEALSFLLLPQQHSPCEPESKIASSAKKLSVFIANKKILGLGVAYEK